MENQKNVSFRGEWIHPETEIRYGQNVAGGGVNMAANNQGDNILNETDQFIQKMEEVEQFRQILSLLPVLRIRIQNFLSDPDPTQKNVRYRF